MGNSRFSNVCSKPIEEDALWGCVKMALCNPYLLLFCLPATDTVELAVFLHNAPNSPEKLTVLWLP
jgi:hypothetical protein